MSKDNSVKRCLAKPDLIMNQVETGVDNIIITEILKVVFDNIKVGHF